MTKFVRNCIRKTKEKASPLLIEYGQRGEAFMKYEREKEALGTQWEELNFAGYRTRRKRRRQRMLMKGVLRASLFLVIVLLFVGAASFVKGLLLPKGISQVFKTISSNRSSGAISKSQRKQLEENKDSYPQRLLEALELNEELIDFVLVYPEKIGTYEENIWVSVDEEREIPLFLQWDERWGYADYGNGCIGLDGCGPTCLSMVLVGLTENGDYHPKAVADFSMKNGYVTEFSGTQWALMTEGAKALGLCARELPLLEQQMINELEEGHPIICSMRPGDFTTTGHFIVIYKYQNGEFFVNDPNSRQRSEKGYGYERISSQIKAMWVYEY